MKARQTQLDMRENAASARRHASRSEKRTRTPQPSVAYNSQKVSRIAVSHELPNGATVEKDDERLLTIQQVADILHVPVSWVYGRTRRRSTERLPGIRLGKYWRFREAETSIGLYSFPLRVGIPLAGSKRFARSGAWAMPFHSSRHTGDATVWGLTEREKLVQKISARGRSSGRLRGR